MVHIIRSKNMTNLDTRQTFCLDNAVYFTAIRGRRPSTRTRMQFDTIEEAKQYAQQFGDGCTMIYAVTAKGSSDHIVNA
jgi:hypothetical protein